MKYIYQNSTEIDTTQFRTTDNGWLGQAYNVGQEGKNMFDTGATVVTIEDESVVVGYWPDHIELFENDGEYIHRHFIPLTPPSA